MIKDVELTRTQNGYDWKFNPTDISTVSGLQRLKSAVINAVYTRYGELSMEVYLEHGSHLFEYIRAKNSSQNMEYVKEAVILACKNISGVEDAQVELHRTEEGIMIDEVIIMTIAGVEVSLGAI